MSSLINQYIFTSSMLNKSNAFIEKTIQKGDADLYIAQAHISQFPTYQTETYCLQSTTCGIDVVHVPKWFKRPIYLGIYGHPSHEVSKYTLDIIQKQVPGEEFKLNLFELDEENETLVINEEYDENIDKEEQVIDIFGIPLQLVWNLMSIIIEVLFL
ncbi:UPF0669 protein C6orf120 homolog [Daktulosphaira vitifoliae]|uniref:UPF0669 protein C6orf120 homolog n=1 Tax=Daktulosphaira vitifoliae TaxID=58002 RepID=UPI0021AA967E|nr:UPF0669 protein C6orf120 homolog [Daktulosphaira vitifoliae]